MVGCARLSDDGRGRHSGTLRVVLAWVMGAEGYSQRMSSTINSWSRVMEHTSLATINPRRWLVLAVVVAGQFMYVVDIFIVNVAIPSIRADLNASPAQIESVIA